MVETHKHKGVERSNGSLRPHPINRKHGNQKVQKWHDQELSSKRITSTKANIVTPKKQQKSSKNIVPFKENDVTCHLDNDGYIYVDLTKETEALGLRVKFLRQEGRTRRTVGLQIEK